MRPIVIQRSNLPRRGLGQTTTTTATPTVATGGTPPNYPPWYSRRGFARQNWTQPYTQAQQTSSATSQLQVSQPVVAASTAPSSATTAAFITALNFAVQNGLITATQDGAYQTQAQNSTDSQVQALTAQLNALAPAATSATSTSTTGWWNGSTVLFGNTIQNSTLAIGGVVALGLGWLFFKKK